MTVIIKKVAKKPPLPMTQGGFKGKGTLYIGTKGGKMVEVGKVSDLKIGPVKDVPLAGKSITVSMPMSVPHTLNQQAYVSRVMGIDVSTDTGIVVLRWDKDYGAWRTEDDFEINLPSLPKTATMKHRMERVRELQMRIVAVVQKYGPEVIAIEGYGYANAHSLVTLVEFGAAVRLAMLNHVLPQPSKLLEVSPASLKKYILGKGVGKKEQVMMQVFKKWGYEARTNNLADAYVLAQIAAASTGNPFAGPDLLPLTKQQQEVLKVVEAKNS